MRLVAVLNVLQDMADSHANLMGLGFDYCHEHGLAWVGANYHLKIERLPKWGEEILIQTWPAQEKKLGAVRDFRVVDEAGNDIIIASSQWILIDFARKRPVAIREHLPFYQVVDDRILETDFLKIFEPEKIDYVKDFEVRFDDIDINGHVNNAVYPLWALESIMPEYREKKQIAELEIAFKKEGFLGQNIKVEVSFDENVSTHIIKAELELSRIKIFWKNRV